MLPVCRQHFRLLLVCPLVELPRRQNHSVTIIVPTIGKMLPARPKQIGGTHLLPAGPKMVTLLLQPLSHETDRAVIILATNIIFTRPSMTH